MAASGAQARAPGVCQVVFEATCAITLPGDQLCVVGDSEALGNWDPHRGLVLQTGPETFPVWSGSMWLSPSAWKLVVLRAGGGVEWEPGTDRCWRWPQSSLQGVSWVARASFGSAAPAELAPAPPAHGGIADAGPCAVSQVPQLTGLRKRSGPSVSSIASTHDPASEEEEDGSSSAGESRRSRINSPLGGEAEAMPLPQQELERLLRPRAVPADPEVDLCAAEGAVHLWSGAHSIPKPGGRCEDAYFCGASGLGVADGVGSMAQFKRHGVDAAAYSADLMQVASEAACLAEVAGGKASAAAVAAAAVERAESKAVTYGASTITVLSLLGGVAGVANIGDSGFMLMRQTAQGMSTVLRSTEQQHSWNRPFQLMRLPPVLAKQAEKKGVRLDTAADSQIYEFPVLPGDLLLLFTDGLSDNLHEHEVLDICGRASPPRTGRGEAAGLATQPGDLARALAAAARERSQDSAAWVPFSEASRRYGCENTGGKEDDITVVAAWVMPGEPRH